jgi:hypothetical protein
MLSAIILSVVPGFKSRPYTTQEHRELFAIFFGVFYKLGRSDD